MCGASPVGNISFAVAPCSTQPTFLLHTQVCVSMSRTDWPHQLLVCRRKEESWCTLRADQGWVLGGRGAEGRGGGAGGADSPVIQELPDRKLSSEPPSQRD